MGEQQSRHPLDACPGCGRPMALVLEVLGGPGAPGGGAFRFCEGCLERDARAGADRRRLDRRASRLLAREVLRLRALVPPALQHERYLPRTVAEAQGSDPALPRTLGEAAERQRRRAPPE